MLLAIAFVFFFALMITGAVHGAVWGGFGQAVFIIACLVGMAYAIYRGHAIMTAKPEPISPFAVQTEGP